MKTTTTRLTRSSSAGSVSPKSSRGKKMPTVTQKLRVRQAKMERRRLKKRRKTLPTEATPQSSSLKSRLRRVNSSVKSTATSRSELT